MIGTSLVGVWGWDSRVARGTGVDVEREAAGLPHGGNLGSAPLRIDAADGAFVGICWRRLPGRGLGEAYRSFAGSGDRNRVPNFALALD